MSWNDGTVLSKQNDKTLNVSYNFFNKLMFESIKFREFPVKGMLVANR